MACFKILFLHFPSEKPTETSQKISDESVDILHLAKTMKDSRLLNARLESKLLIIMINHRKECK